MREYSRNRQLSSREKVVSHIFLNNNNKVIEDDLSIKRIQSRLVYLDAVHLHNHLYRITIISINHNTVRKKRCKTYTINTNIHITE